MKKIRKNSLSFLCILLVMSSLFITGCRAKNTQKTVKKDTVELTYYRLFDDEEVIKPMIQEYQSENRNVKIQYRKFTDPVEYENLILNELAEGEGPDIFSIHNTWIVKHQKKIIPMPADMMTLDEFQNTFVGVAGEDLILKDDKGEAKIVGIPLYVDTLALYYNKKLYEDKIPSRGSPPKTWEDLKDDVYKLNKKDNSFERFEVAGIALGRADNISRATDIVSLMLVQNKVKLYDDTYTEAIFGRTEGLIGNPAENALSLYTSFALPQNKNYSWNEYLSDAKSKEKEILTFARGKVTMIVGYSYLYKDILDQIEMLKEKGMIHIDKDDIAVTEIPQIFDPQNNKLARDTYVSYFAETVTRTSDYPEEAWKFIKFLSSKENIQYYHEKTGKPTSRRDLIEEESQEAIYGAFARQLGYARSIPMADAQKYEEALKEAIQAVVEKNQSPQNAINQAKETINKSIPKEGLYPNK